MKNGADMNGCLDRDTQGWDNYVQTEIIDLLKQWEKKY
jgi:hypothetical protein